MAKSKNLGLAKLQTPVSTEPGKTEKPVVVFPPSPTNTCTVGPSSPQESDSDKDEVDAWSVQCQTPRDSKPASATNSITMAGASGHLEAAGGATVSSDILAIAQLQASMKEALLGLANVMEHVGKQSVLMSQFAAQIKERNELSTLQSELQQQIAKQKDDLDNLKIGLEARIKQTAEDVIKRDIKDIVDKSIGSVIEEKVRQELSIQIPDHIKQRSMSHERDVLEVQAELHNSEARRYNASLQSASSDAPLRPLLRPVPTPEQSPYPILVTSATDSSAPASSFPFSEHLRPPVPPPMRRSLSTRSTSTAPSAISRSQSLQMTAATPSVSALFPKDLKSLFSLDPGSTRTLLKEYGLQSCTPSPAVEEPMYKFKPPSMPHSPATQKPPSPVEEESESEEDVESHMTDMNTFMSHIGVPFKMVPPPQVKETNAEKRKKLAPLIISNWAGPR